MKLKFIKKKFGRKKKKFRNETQDEKDGISSKSKKSRNETDDDEDDEDVDISKYELVCNEKSIDKNKSSTDEDGSDFD